MKVSNFAASCILTIKTAEPAKGNLKQSPSEQSTNLPGLVQAAAHSSKRGAHDVWNKAVQQSAEGWTQDDGQRVGEPGGQTARDMLLARVVER